MSSLMTAACKRMTIELTDGTTYEIEMREGWSDLTLSLKSEPIETEPDAGLFRRFVSGPMMVRVELSGEAKSARRIAAREATDG